MHLYKAITLAGLLGLVACGARSEGQRLADGLGAEETASELATAEAEPYTGKWESMVASYGLFTNYLAKLSIRPDGGIRSHSVGSGSFYLQPGCTVATTIEGTWTPGGTKKAPMIHITWTKGVDRYSGCDDPANDTVQPYDQDKLAGPAATPPSRSATTTTRCR